MSRAMKDSGIPWIGEIPSHWETDNIGSLYSQRNEKVSDKDYPPLSVSKMGVVPQLETAAKTDDGDNRKLVRKGDFAINSRSDRRGSCGISVYDGSVSLINTILTPRTEMNPRFYDWLFHTSVFADEFYKWGHGIVDDLWTTRWAEMKRISIVVPPIHEQQSIADFLDKKCGEIDEMVSLQEKIVEDLKAYKQSVITEAVCKGLNPDVPMKDSGIVWIGEIPLSTEIIRLKYVSEISRGLFNHRPRDDEKYYNGGFPFIQTGDVARSGKYITSYSQTLSKLGTTVSKLFPKGTMTMTIAANVGDVAILDFDAYFPDSVLGIVPNDNVQKNYLYYVITASKPALINAATANAQLNLNVQSVGNILIPLSPIKEQQAIADYLDTKCAEIDTLISLKQSKIDALKEYKKSIIYEYITGKKEVPNGEQ